MNKDLKIIKKKYGEKMMHYVRENLASLLEIEGKLPNIMLSHFEPNHSLYDDLIKANLLNEFKNYLYSIDETEKTNIKKNIKTPREIFNSLGYEFYECYTEEDIQKFICYYAPGEELCTFREKRLDTNYIFWVVKKDAHKIKRKKIPNRQDEYGTSVMSIQFTKDKYHTLSIKNRYNHTVDNPDATYSNELDNIYPGLTESFASTYGLVQRKYSNNFVLPNYVLTNDLKYYKYNYEINNIFYCPNNIIIDNYKVKRYSKDKYLIIDYFILDLVNKKMYTYDFFIDDYFTEEFKNIKSIKLINKNKQKIIVINENKIITLDKFNNIIGISDKEIKVIENGYLICNKLLKEIDLPNIEYIGNDFLSMNIRLKEICFPKVLIIGDNFIRNNTKINRVNLNNVINIGSMFLNLNNDLESISLPNLKTVKKCFLNFNRQIKETYFPNLEKIGDYFMFHNTNLDNIKLPKIKTEVKHLLKINKKKID